MLGILLFMIPAASLIVPPVMVNVSEQSSIASEVEPVEVPKNPKTFKPAEKFSSEKLEPEQASKPVEKAVEQPVKPSASPVQASSVTCKAIMTPEEAKACAQEKCTARGWGGAEFNALVQLWTKESGWDMHAVNPSSGAGGIPQALPSSKMGANAMNDANAQIEWGLNYIANRYGSPSQAWAHSCSVGWY